MRYCIVVLLSFLFLAQVSAQDSQKRRGISQFYQNQLVGLKNYDTEEILLPPIYKQIGFSSKMYVVANDTASGVFDATLRKFVVPMEYQSIHVVGDEKQPYFIVEKGG